MCGPRKRANKETFDLSCQRNHPLYCTTQWGNPTPGEEKRGVSSHETITEHAASTLFTTLYSVQSLASSLYSIYCHLEPLRQLTGALSI